MPIPDEVRDMFTEQLLLPIIAQVDREMSAPNFSLPSGVSRDEYRRSQIEQRGYQRLQSQLTNQSSPFAQAGVPASALGDDGRLNRPLSQQEAAMFVRQQNGVSPQQAQAEQAASAIGLGAGNAYAAAAAIQPQGDPLAERERWARSTYGAGDAAYERANRPNPFNTRPPHVMEAIRGDRRTYHVGAADGLPGGEFGTADFHQLQRLRQQVSTIRQRQYSGEYAPRDAEAMLGQLGPQISSLVQRNDATQEAERRRRQRQLMSQDQLRREMMAIQMAEMEEMTRANAAFRARNVGDLHRTVNLPGGGQATMFQTQPGRWTQLRADPQQAQQARTTAQDTARAQRLEQSVTTRVRNELEHAITAGRRLRPSGDFDPTNAAWDPFLAARPRWADAGPNWTTANQNEAVRAEVARRVAEFQHHNQAAEGGQPEGVQGAGGGAPPVQQEAFEALMQRLLQTAPARTVTPSSPRQGLLPQRNQPRPATNSPYDMPM